MRNIKRNINIRSEQIGGQFNELFQLINEIESCGSEEISLDFSATSFVTPFFLLPLFVHIRNHPKTIIIKNLPEYLHTVHFDEEIYPERLPQGLASFLEDYRLKTYIPILSFPNEAKQIGFKNEILHAAENLIMQRLNIPVNVRGGIKYLISEAVDNISEHSESERGYIFMQYYSYLGYLDICIADRGITVFVTTHYMDEAEYCNRVSIMVDGRIEALDTPRGLKAHFHADTMDDVFQQLARKAVRKAD